MLSDQCAKVEGLATNLAKTRQLKAQAKGVQNRWRQITALQRRLGDLVAASEQLKKHKIQLTEPAAPSKALRKNLTEIRKLADSALIEFIDSPRVTEFTSSHADDYLGRLERALKKAWVQQISSIAPLSNPDFLNVLLKINVFAATVRRVNDLNSQLARRKETLPQSAEDFEDLKKIVTELATAWQQIGGDKVPAKVREFLSEAVSPQGASLKRLDNEVTDWLGDHKIDDQFVIRNRRF